MWVCKTLLKKISRRKIIIALYEESRKVICFGKSICGFENETNRANPGINFTIKDRYFISACATPQIVFPNLIKLFGHHTAKMEYGYERERNLRNLVEKLDVENPLVTPSDGYDFEDYKLKVNRYIETHKDYIAIWKPRNSLPLTTQNYQVLSDIFTQKLGINDNYTREFGDTPFGILIRKVAKL